MKKNKIKLSELNVSSFVTASQIKGGAELSCDCSLTTFPVRVCNLACSDACPTDGC